LEQVTKRAGLFKSDFLLAGACGNYGIDDHHHLIVISFQADNSFAH
jgi:hypothetical protein